MNESDLINKIAYDCNGVKLGKITNVQWQLNQKTQLPQINFTVTKSGNIMKPLNVDFSFENIIEIKKSCVWLKISKKEFEDKIKKMKTLRKQMVKNSKFGKATELSKADALGFVWFKV